MTKKKGHNKGQRHQGPSANPEFHKTVPIIRDFALNPSCSHGPTILFDRNGSRFFSCSAFRSKALCPFHLSEEEWNLSKDSSSKKRKLNMKIEEIPHKIAKKCSPLTLPTQVDKGEAQYHFTDDTTRFFINLFQKLGITSVVCIGTPSLHKFINENKSTLKINSFLLDIDQRFKSEYNSDEFALYNMVNHHFFEGDGKVSYELFLKDAASLAIVTDPPFGAKVELIWNGGLKSVKNDFSSLHKDKERKCEVFWIFPYFMEGHILSKCQDGNLSMSDYKVMYKNHAKFKEKSNASEITTNGKSSPVRIFTSLPLPLMELPEPNYRFCDKCRFWVERRNLHCDICKKCTTKDGGDCYWHCKKCGICVKPTWSHCDSPCESCHLINAKCGHRKHVNTNRKD